MRTDLLALLIVLLLACCDETGSANCRDTATKMITDLRRDYGLEFQFDEDECLKSRRGSKVNSCSNLQRTCCCAELETELVKETSKNFKQDLFATVMRDITFCDTENSLPDAMKMAVMKALELFSLTTRLNSPLVASGVVKFEVLVSHLKQPSADKSFLCSLSSTIELQLADIIRQLHPNASTVHDECFHLEVQKYGKAKQSIEDALRPTLERARYVLLAHSYLQRTIEFVQTFKASQYCVDKLMEMTFCSFCGGVAPVSVCHGLCMNTVQGCVVEFADLADSLQSLVLVLEELQTQLTGAHSLSQAMRQLSTAMVEYTRSIANNSPAISASLQECSSREKRLADGTMVHDEQNVGDTSKVTDVIPDAPPENLISKMLADELKCIRHQVISLTNVPGQVCSNRYLIEEGMNENCWTGSMQGSYKHAVAEYSRRGLKQNPLFSLESVKDKNRLSNDTEDFVRHVKEVIDPNYKCFDDEDCKVSLLEECSDLGSGFGSGSGSGMDRGSGSGEPEPPTTTTDQSTLITEPATSVTSSPDEDTRPSVYTSGTNTFPPVFVSDTDTSETPTPATPQGTSGSTRNSIRLFFILVFPFFTLLLWYKFV